VRYAISAREIQKYNFYDEKPITHVMILV